MVNRFYIFLSFVIIMLVSTYGNYLLDCMRNREELAQVIRKQLTGGRK